MSMITIQRALLSVSDKTHLIELASCLTQQGIEILSTGGTARTLREANIPLIEVSDYTGFPEMMDGRVKTLHPKIHGGILARRRQDLETLAQHHIPPIDLVVVNLYPFAKTIASPKATFQDAIENIDIGGPTLIRAAAKNHEDVCVMVDPSDYTQLIHLLKEHKGQLPRGYALEMASKAFSHTAAYDALISQYFREKIPSSTPFPPQLTLSWNKKEDLRYGENPHQRAAFYVEPQVNVPCIATATQHQGKALSFNNLVDANGALECVKAFGEAPTCVIVKHANPCGVAMGRDLLEAYNKAFQTDPTSAFGGIIALNQTLEEELAAVILQRQFVEVIIAPAITEKACQVFAVKPNVRLLSVGNWHTSQKVSSSFDYGRLKGGLLVQDEDPSLVDPNTFKVVTHRQPTEEEWNDCLFLWKVAQYVKSNAIVYGKQLQTLGIGAGQMSRVYSAKIAALKAEAENLSLKGCAMASDAFFPFRDGIDTAATYGISTIIQPGGSIRDEEVIQAANEAGIAMIFTGIRHFFH